MLITIEEQEAALTPIFEEIAGITEYLTDFPDTFKPAQLPCLVTIPGDATYDRATGGADSLGIRRRWEAILVIALSDPTREFQSQQKTKPFLTSIPLALAEHPTITLDDGRGFQLEVHQGSDRGARAIRYNGNSYTGSMFSFYTLIEDTIDPVDAF